MKHFFFLFMHLSIPRSHNWLFPAPLFTIKKKHLSKLHKINPLKRQGQELNFDLWPIVITAE